MFSNATKKTLAVIIVLLSMWMMLANTSRIGSSQSFLQEFASIAKIALEPQNQTMEGDKNTMHSLSRSKPTVTLQSIHPTIQLSTATATAPSTNSTNSVESTVATVEYKRAISKQQSLAVPTNISTGAQKLSSQNETIAAQTYHAPAVQRTSSRAASNNSDAAGGVVSSKMSTMASAVASQKIESKPSKREQRIATARFNRVTKAWSNVTTLTYFQGHFYAGYRNQIMAFTLFVMQAARQNHSQILLAGLRHKDTFGTNKNIPHETLFDVEHWNSHYPALPRLVGCDPVLHAELIACTKFNPRFEIENPEANATRPFAFGKQGRLLGAYMRYSKGRGPYAKPQFRNPIELTMLRGAMQPHPKLRAIADGLIASLGEGNEYMTLHARVEPDMQKHLMCWNKKETNLTKIFEDLERKFPKPPAPMVFLPINRQYMEQEGSGPNKKDPKETNWLAIENLSALNRVVSHGLWNGTVKVFEFGAKSLQGTSFASRWSTAGAVLNFYIAIGGNVFVGTEVSSYSIDLLSTRFYRGNRKNYKYLPDGLHEWTPEGTNHSPAFVC